MAEVEAPQRAAQQDNHASQQPCLAWWELLASLKKGCNELIPLLEQAKAAVATDAQWNTSGVPELLKRALDMARRGSVEAARTYAIGLLDFQLAAQKYRAKARSAATGGSSGDASEPKKQQDEVAATSSSSTSSDVTSTGIHQAAGDVSHHPSGSAVLTLERLATAVSDISAEPITPSSISGGLAQQERDDAVFAAPEPPSKRRRVVPTDTSAPRLEGRLHLQRPLPAVELTSSSDTRLSIETQDWSGVLGLVAEDGGRTSDMCHAILQLPKHVVRTMPRAVHFTHLVQRRGVMLGRYQVVRTIIKKANMRQMSRLRSMAQHELVAVAALEHVHVIMVPYQDNAGELKLVSFALCN